MSDKPTCRTCKHWSQSDGDWYGVGEPMVYFRICKHEKSHDAGGSPDGMNIGPVFPQDGHSVYTGPDFGCIHWEPKETA